jgi:predicted transcriptional regulator
MVKKRFKDQIIAEILKTCEGEGTSKTKLVYASGLNFHTINFYLATLDTNDLIEIAPGKIPLYKTTPKGRTALRHLKAIEKLISIQ